MCKLFDTNTIYFRAVEYQANLGISIANSGDSFFQRNDVQVFMPYVVIPAKAGIPINNRDSCMRRNDCK